MAFISDGARWLDELHDLSFPLAERIVDFLAAAVGKSALMAFENPHFWR